MQLVMPETCKTCETSRVATIVPAILPVCEELGRGVLGCEAIRDGKALPSHFMASVISIS